MQKEIVKSVVKALTPWFVVTYFLLVSILASIILR